MYNPGKKTLSHHTTSNNTQKLCTVNVFYTDFIPLDLCFVTLKILFTEKYIALKIFIRTRCWCCYNNDAGVDSLHLWKKLNIVLMYAEQARMITFKLKINSQKLHDIKTKFFFFMLNISLDMIFLECVQHSSMTLYLCHKGLRFHQLYTYFILIVEIVSIRQFLKLFFIIYS